MSVSRERQDKKRGLTFPGFFPFAPETDDGKRRERGRMFLSAENQRRKNTRQGCFLGTGEQLFSILGKRTPQSAFSFQEEEKSRGKNRELDFDGEQDDRFPCAGKRKNLKKMENSTIRSG